MKRLMVHSKSTSQYVSKWTYDRLRLVQHPPTKETLEEAGKWETVIAIGGGSVIDTAKILCCNQVIAIPTTYSGASRTEHAVYWYSGRKYNMQTPRPITVTMPEYLETVTEEFARYSKIDCLCHILESTMSVRTNPQSWLFGISAARRIDEGDWLNASLLAGDAINISGTNVIHALSYALTSIYEVPHAKALAYVFPRIYRHYVGDKHLFPNIQVNVALEIDPELVVDLALTYPKIRETILCADREFLLEVIQ